MGLEPDFDLVEDIRNKLLDIAGTSRLDLSPELSARRVYDRIIMGPRPGEESFAEFTIDGEGMYPLPQAGLRLQVKLRAHGGEDPHAAAADESTAWLDAERLSFPLRVRVVRDGDRFHPLGSPGTRKLQDFLVDAKVPREERSMIAVVESAGEIAWVVGMRIDERFKVRGDTVQVAVLSVIGG
jgi:tRNA(Ile)-lysidine synthase